MKLAARSLVVWLVIMTMEAGNGLLRQVFLELFFDDIRSRQIGVVIGSLVIVGVAFGFAGWLKSKRTMRLLLIGMFWVVLTIAFEVVVGLGVMHLSMARIWSDYDVAKGGLMPFGLVVMMLAPLMGSWLHRRLRVRKRRKQRSRQETVPATTS